MSVVTWLLFSAIPVQHILISLTVTNGATAAD